MENSYTPPHKPSNFAPDRWIVIDREVEKRPALVVSPSGSVDVVAIPVHKWYFDSQRSAEEFALRKNTMEVVKVSSAKDIHGAKP